MVFEPKNEIENNRKFAHAKATAIYVYAANDSTHDMLYAYSDKHVHNSHANTVHLSSRNFSNINGRRGGNIGKLDLIFICP